MKNLKILSTLFLACLFLNSCSSEQSNKTLDQENLARELQITKQELKNELDNRKNPITEILKSYAETSRASNVDLQSDMKLSYERITQRSQLVAIGKLSNEEYFNDINGCFEPNAGFKTELGKLISKHYKDEYYIKKQKGSVENSSSYEKYEKIQELKEDLKKYENK
ncbi:MAG: hypothetical protein ACSHXF_13450 [Aquaticitalea sp.]